MRMTEVASWIGSLVTITLVVTTVHVHAGRPLITDDADPVEKGRVEAEFGLELETSGNSYSLTAPFGFGFGVTDWLEVAIKPSVLFVDDQEASPRRVAGVGDLVLEAKARLPFNPFDLNLALVPSLKLPTADEDRGLGTGEVDGGALLVVTKEFTEVHKLHFNVGYTVTGKVPGAKLEDVLFIGLAGETSIPGLAEDRWQVVAEIFGTTKEEEDGRGDIQGRLGVRYFAVADLILDAAVGRSLTARPQVELFATLGLTWTFDTPWKRGKMVGHRF
jgi:hypothetical protein